MAKQATPKPDYKDIETLFEHVLVEDKSKLVATLVEMTKYDGPTVTHHVNLREWYWSARKGEWLPKRNGLFLDWDPNTLGVLNLMTKAMLQKYAGIDTSDVSEEDADDYITMVTETIETLDELDVDALLAAGRPSAPRRGGKVKVNIPTQSSARRD